MARRRGKYEPVRFPILLYTLLNLNNRYEAPPYGSYCVWRLTQGFGYDVISYLPTGPFNQLIGSEVDRIIRDLANSCTLWVAGNRWLS